MSNELEKINELYAMVEELQNSVDLWKKVGLPRKTIIILLQHATKLSQADIKMVLDGIDNLFDAYFTEES